MTAFTLGPEDRGRRADKSLGRRRPGWPFTKIQKLFRKRRVTLDGRPIAADARLPGGGELRIIAPDPEAAPAPLLPNRKIRLAVLFEDAHVVVINKRAGLAMSPGPGHGSDTLAAALLGHDPARAKVFGPSEEYGLVHRLDKDTSGVLIAARSPAAYEALIAAFAGREVRKRYRALTVGAPASEEGLIDQGIIPPSPGQPQARCDPTGLEARTSWRLVERGRDWGLVECFPETGRTHQLRVHLAAIGLPVLGDALYGPEPPGAGRAMLHAAELALAHPIDRRPMSWSAPDPRDFSRRLGRARSRRPSPP